MSIAANIRTLRRGRGWSQEQLAEKLGYKSYTTIQKWESGVSQPPLSRVQQLAELFHVSVAELTGSPSAPLIYSPETASYEPTHRIPILGRISAGLPLYADEQIEGYTYTMLNGGAEYFALRVKGDSMTALRIYEDDILIVRRQDQVENGEIAVVMVNNEEATVKCFSRQGDTVILEPKSLNPEHRTQIYPLQTTSIRILGKVVQSQISF